jgi:hypothetical protein
MSEAYSLFFRLFLEKFLRASGIWWQFFTDREGKSLHRVVSDNPEKAIEQFTGGKTDLLGRIVLEKFEAALILWAIEAMGDDFEKYVGRGLQGFFTGVMLSPRPKRSFLAATRESPLYFPVQLRKESGFPFDRFGKLKKEYETILSRVSELKRKKYYSGAAYTLALMGALPKTSRERAKSYRFMKPSEVALEYVSRQYKLPLGSEAMKKYLHPKRVPQDLWDMELRRITAPIKKSLPSASVKFLQ